MMAALRAADSKSGCTLYPTPSQLIWKSLNFPLCKMETLNSHKKAVSRIKSNDMGKLLTLNNKNSMIFKNTLVC